MSHLVKFFKKKQEERSKNPQARGKSIVDAYSAANNKFADSVIETNCYVKLIFWLSTYSPNAYSSNAIFVERHIRRTMRKQSGRPSNNSPDHNRHHYDTTRDRKRHSSPAKAKSSSADVSEVPLPRSHHTNRSAPTKAAYESSPRHYPRRSSPKSSNRSSVLNQLTTEFSKSGISSYRDAGRTSQDFTQKRNRFERSQDRPLRETFGSSSFSRGSTDRYSKDDYTSNKSSRESSPKRYGGRTSPKTSGFLSDYQKRDRYHVRSSSDMSISPTRSQKSNNRTDGKNSVRILRKAINELSPDKPHRSSSPKRLSRFSNSDDFSSHDKNRNGSSNIDFRPNSGFKPNQFGRKWSPDKFIREPTPEKACRRPSINRYDPPNRHSHDGLPNTHVKSQRQTEGLTPEQASIGVPCSQSIKARTPTIGHRNLDTHLESSSRSYQASSPNYSTGEISHHRLFGRTPNRDTPEPPPDKRYRGSSANKPDQGFACRFIGAWTPNADHQEQPTKVIYSRPLKGKSPDAPLYSRLVGARTPNQNTYEPPPKTAMDLATPNTPSYQFSPNRTTGEWNSNQYGREPSLNDQIAEQTPNTFFGRTSFSGHIPEMVYDVNPGECTPNYATRETPQISIPIGVKPHNSTFPPAYFMDGYCFVRPPGTLAPNFSTNGILPIGSNPLNIPISGQSPGMPPFSCYTGGTTPNRDSYNPLPAQLMRAPTPDRPIYGTSPNRAPSGLPFTSTDRGRTPGKPIRGPSPNRPFTASNRMRVLQPLNCAPSGIPFTKSDRGTTPDKPIRGPSPNRPFTESNRMRVLQTRLSKLNFFGPKVEKHWKIVSEKASILETISAALEKKGTLLKEGRKLDEDILNISYGTK
ncbi:hypothetical protein DdX_09947 [Ditylenchus destructor]|uniref:Uncharacterized protein n=1 Tax=Ditylenchus destructor TaxID=166010 RepID=A0AAD4N590_9BILA|nr:hypothetical protein DdX_09947 [Ditylenchus destructor]